MQLTAFLITCLATIQLAFAISLDQNSTHVPDTRQHYDGATNGSSLNGVSKRYAEYFTSGHTVNYNAEPWPVRSKLYNTGEGYIRRIPFCIVDENAWKNFGSNLCRIRSAINLWETALGGRPGRENGHSLGFREPKDPTEWCCRSYNIEGNVCDWDHDKWPADTLAIHWMENHGEDGFSTVGYMPADNPRDRPGRHSMHLTSEATPTTIAHELGHVMGMIHEHQRWDRDDYLEFRCKNLWGINDSISKVTAHEGITSQEAAELLCNNAHKAREYDAPSVPYIKGDGLDPATKPQLDGPGGFDRESIMLYDSYLGSYDTIYDVNLDSAVLVTIRKDANGNKIPGSDTMFRAALRPSQRDAEFVRRFYPWDESKFEEWEREHPGENPEGLMKAKVT